MLKLSRLIVAIKSDRDLMMMVLIKGNIRKQPHFLELFLRERGEVFLPCCLDK